MRLLVLAACLCAARALSWPQNCAPVDGDESEIFCQHVGGANVRFYIFSTVLAIHCMGTNFTCSDLPVLNLSTLLPLKHLSIESCPPSLLPCITKVLNTPSVSELAVIDGAAPLQGEHVAALEDVQSITINGGLQKSFPSSVIEALPNLRHLKIFDTQVTLQPHAFLNATHIETLELNNAVTGNVPEDAFRGFANLKTLHMSKNDIGEIGVNSLRGLDSLRRLFLIGNHVSHIAAGALAHAPRLQRLVLFRNQLDELPPGLLSNLTELEDITITQTPNDPPLKLYRDSLQNLPSFKHFIITECHIDLPDDLFTGCDELRTLDLSNNKITSLPVNIFKGLSKLERLDLNGNKIAVVKSGVFAPLKKLKHLNMDDNYLEYLPDFLFAGLVNLNYLSMDYNQLSNISSQAFSGANALETLSLQHNKLTIGNQNSPFAELYELKYLYLNGNEISKMIVVWKPILRQLKYLDLSDNNLTVISEYDFQFASEGLQVDLRRNNISEIKLVDLTEFMNDFKIWDPTNILLLNDNPFNCDCGLYDLAMSLKGFNKSLVYFKLDNAICASPSRLKGRLFKSVSPNDLNCELPVEKCYHTTNISHRECLSCEIRPAYSELVFDCVSLPQNLLSPKYFNMTKMSLKLKTPPKSISGLNLKVLNVSNIGLVEIPFSPSRTVETIDFSTNKLTEIPMQFLEANISLYLANNPFTCDCLHSEELSTLKLSKNVLDISLTKCGENLLSTVDPLNLCNNWRTAVAIATFIALVLIVAVLATIIYRHEILVFIINHGLCPCCFIDDPDDINKEYDVFVSYAHKDRQYLEKLMPKLEEEFGLKTCVHYRDWFVGDFIPDQINRSVEKSRKTIILLSNSFLDSGYANMEFRAAHNLALRDGKIRVILILLEDVTKHEKLSEELNTHMKMNTFLKWDDARFSQRLQIAVSLRTDKKFVWPKVFKQAGENTVKSGLDVHLNNDG